MQALKCLLERGCGGWNRPISATFGSFIAAHTIAEKWNEGIIIPIVQELLLFRFYLPTLLQSNQLVTGTIRKKSFLSDFPSWALSVLTLIIATVVLFVTDELVHSFDKGGLTAYIIYDLLIAAACFFIIRRNPQSVWYVPLICNVLLIISAFVEPNFWRTSMWIPVCSGWVLSLIASSLGILVGKRNAVRKNE